MKTVTRERYRASLIKVIEYMYQHIDRELDVNTLADVANLSPYHFHRIYREIAQENVNATVRRLRLQKAAAELIRDDLAIARIAEQVGYSKVEAFSRAFKKQFGESPGQYRQLRVHQNNRMQPFVAMLPVNKEDLEMSYEVEINEVEPVKLIGLDHQGDYMDIGKTFEQLSIIAETRGYGDQSSRSFGLYYDDPGTVAKDKLRSTACLSVGSEFNLTDSDLRAITLPGGKMASITFKGAYAELEQAYEWFYGQWLPDSGLEMADHPPIEEYLNDAKTTPPAELLTRISCLLA